MFDFIPRVLFVHSAAITTGYERFHIINPATKAYLGDTYSSSYANMTIAWSDKTVSWYNKSGGTQLNESGTTYHYTAIG